VRRWLLPLLVLSVASVLVFGGPLFFDRTFFYRDVPNYYWPTREAIVGAWRALELPLWMSGTMMGLPLLADPHSGAFYPPNALYLLCCLFLARTRSCSSSITSWVGQGFSRFAGRSGSRSGQASSRRSSSCSPGTSSASRGRAP
jgi:hypothetical protein